MDACVSKGLWLHWRKIIRCVTENYKILKFLLPGAFDGWITDTLHKLTCSEYSWYACVCALISLSTVRLARLVLWHVLLTKGLFNKIMILIKSFASLHISVKNEKNGKTCLMEVVFFTKVTKEIEQAWRVLLKKTILK